MKGGPLAAEPPQRIDETVYMVRDEESGKAKLVKIWEDPTMFVSYALRGLLPVGDLTELAKKEG